ncbi:SDR family NAD(P)-dependent oxidoreductase [Sedimentitalea nanhaiensis]|uniref:3-oxoacyl-[acyl-carrier protein] reductase n=1 Tax=Sedimentitalea nanhaiensis TaxID=999627 RepID=A0A1I7DG22_9RHOB|nr:SDR family oxidoreductase [Sedimentitalea nanhaiensis]SFU10614.1 3-oxoacyl-[acyl-carrier protein] reductase [Sedimentitalea nanhaiensis]
MDITTDTRVLVTGGASGIGLATVKAFLAAGALVAVNHLPGDPAAVTRIAQLNETYGQGRARSAAGNVSQRDAAEAMIAAAITDLGGLDVLVNNAGTSATKEPIAMSDLDRLDDDFWSTILDTNLMGPFWCSRAAAPHLRKGGAIINTASIAGLGGGASSMAYAASKAALINMTINLARGLGPDIRVNAVAPGLTRTPWTGTWPVCRTERSLASTALKRWVEPEDVAQGIVFLASNPAMTGQTIAIDGGRFS